MGKSCKKLKEIEIREILGTEECDEQYSSDTDYSYECSGHESNNENESDTESDCDDDEQNYNSDENSCVNRYKNLNILWTIEDFIPTVHQFCDAGSGVRSKSFDESSKPVEYFLSLLTPDIVLFIVQETNKFASHVLKGGHHIYRSGSRRMTTECTYSLH
jgi:hypothetical protein